MYSVITFRQFPYGVGQIHLFCLESMELIQKLQSLIINGSSKILSSLQVSTSSRHNIFSYRSFDQKRMEVIRNTLSTSLVEPADSNVTILNRRLSRSEGNLTSVLKEIIFDVEKFGNSENPMRPYLDDVNQTRLHSYKFFYYLLEETSKFYFWKWQDLHN